MATLFDPEPNHWGFRGDPHVWRRMRGHIASRPHPATVEEGIRLLQDAFREIVRCPTARSHERGSSVPIRLDFRGMSGGRVNLNTWRQRLMPLLESRLASAWTDES